MPPIASMKGRRSPIIICDCDGSVHAPDGAAGCPDEDSEGNREQPAEGANKRYALFCATGREEDTRSRRFAGRNVLANIAPALWKA